MGSKRRFKGRKIASRKQGYMAKFISKELKRQKQYAKRMK